MRLIDADAIPYTMLYKENWLAGTGMEKQGVWKDDIDAMPTIEERKKGKWIIHETENDRYDDMICPFCRKSYTVDAYRINDIGFTAEDFNFCPHCGAEF